MQWITGEDKLYKYDADTFRPIYNKYYQLLIAMFYHPYYGPPLRALIRSKFAASW
jgi:hypothetical protein